MSDKLSPINIYSLVKSLPFRILALALLLLYYFVGSRTPDGEFDWSDSGWSKKAYAADNQEPYGTHIFHQLLEKYFDQKKVTDLTKNLVEELPIDSVNRGDSYVFVGNGMYLDSADTQHLLHFVEAGNTALIISKTIPFDLMNLIYFEECEDGYWDDYLNIQDTAVVCRLNAPKTDSISLFFAVKNKPRDYTWAYIPGFIFCDESVGIPLGTFNDSLVNFADFQYGKGHFLLHTTPLSFSNYHLLQPAQRNYAAGVLSWLPESNIYWDGFSRVPEMVTRRRNNRNASMPKEDHALSYILKQEPLAWAWYLFVGLTLCYVVFRGMRRQRTIPVLAQNENSSFEFIKTISYLHFRKRNYKGISIQAMRLFAAEIREKYGLHFSIDREGNITNPEPSFVPRLLAKTGVSETCVRNLFDQYNVIVRFEPEEQNMIDFHLSIDQFWKESKQ